MTRQPCLRLAGYVGNIGQTLPGEILGQAIRAYIAPAPNMELEEKLVLKCGLANMESFMVRKYIEFVDSLPKTPRERIDKQQLKGKEEPGISG